jgi:AraC family transcriptional regulator of adaptative response/methylated-DNA-[protein]-cysteine methyltransferase
MIDEDSCWEAVRSRDAAQDGRFYFGVVTTGVYCRPVCPCRTPLRQNVRFYKTCDDAEADGLRPCLRCKPRQEPLTERVKAACEHIRNHAGEPLNLQDLAQRAGLSPFHFQRTFKSVVGVSPKQFAEACRMERFKRGLRSGGNVTEAIYDAGFGAPSRLYERVPTHLGMTPVEYRDGGEGVSISYVASPTGMGWLMLGATDRGVCFVQFGDDEQQLASALAKEYPRAALEPLSAPYPAQFTLWMDALERHLAGTPVSAAIPLDLRATAFQIKVWRFLQSIPAGSTRSYGEVARGMGKPQAARAVARACASNPVALLIPCHRVIRGDGAMGGYRWGVERKRALLAREGSVAGARVAPAAALAPTP